MKKLFLISLVAVFFISPTFSQIQFGIQAGLNVANIKAKVSTSWFNGSLDSKSMAKPIAGFVADIPITQNVSFRPEVNFIQKGAKWNYSGNRSEVTLNYIELPLNLAYKVQAGPGKVFAGFGPNVSFGISGKEDDSQSGLTETTKVKFDGKKNSETTDGYYHLNAFDFGANIFAGYQMNIGIFLGMGYTLNFTDIHPEDSYNYKNRGFFVKIGYMFSSKGDKKKN